MRQIKIFDTTLRDGEQSPGCSMHLAEKLQIASALESLGVDVIEAGFAICSPGDFESVQKVAELIKNSSVCSLSRAVKGDIDAAYNALKNAASPRIHIFLATSPLHREFKLKMSKEQVLERIAESITYCKQFISDIEFSAEDACRTEIDFLAECCRTAIRAGATTLNIPDTVGYCLPQEVREKVLYLRDRVDGIENVTISAHNHNDLGLATANSLAMVLGGANQIECTINGIGERAGNAALAELVMAIKTRKAEFDCDTRIDTKQLYKVSKLVSTITGSPIPPTKPIVGTNAFAHESGIHQHGVLANPATYEIISPESVGIPQNKIILGKHSGKHAFEEHIKTLGYQLTPEEITKKFEAFKQLTDRKKYINRHDLEALLNDTNVDAKYVLIDYETKCSRQSTTSASVKLKLDEKEYSATEQGNGPLEAIFKAINAIVHPDIKVAEYSVNSVSEDADAQGEAHIKVELDGKRVLGRGISTDTVEASVLAYIDAVNKLLSEH